MGGQCFGAPTRERGGGEEKEEKTVIPTMSINMWQNSGSQKKGEGPGGQDLFLEKKIPEIDIKILPIGGPELQGTLEKKGTY